MERPVLHPFIIRRTVFFYFFVFHHHRLVASGHVSPVSDSDRSSDFLDLVLAKVVHSTRLAVSSISASCGVTAPLNQFGHSINLACWRPRPPRRKNVAATAGSKSPGRSRRLRRRMAWAGSPSSPIAAPHHRDRCRYRPSLRELEADRESHRAMGWQNPT